MQVYNSLTNQMEEFHPLQPPKVNMYVCGITAYDSPHLGHARSAIAFDTIRRYLEYKGYEVKYVQNYTDVDDKMINRANKEGITIFQLAERYIAEYEWMQKQLRIKNPNVRPRATQEIEPMITIIKKLEEKGYIYRTDDGIWFDTSKMPHYKEVFRKKKNAGDSDAEAEEQPFTQSDYADQKRNVEDFVLWKSEKPGEPAWDSAWGRGRPGWHLECSAMSMKYLGETLDIHGGGRDLKDPHHHNEIAQSESANGKQFCRYWLHNGFLNIDHNKMSKSLGNFVTAKAILEKYPGYVVRYFFLTTYYQRPIDFSLEILDQAKISVKRLQKTYQQIKDLKTETPSPLAPDLEKNLLDYIAAFFAAMDEDFNTAKAISHLFSFVNLLGKEVLTPGKAVSPAFKQQAVKFFQDIDTFLDVLTEETDTSQAALLWKERTGQVIDALLKLRQDVRKEKNYVMSDRLRDLLKQLGIQVNDSKSGTTWEWP